MSGALEAVTLEEGDVVAGRYRVVRVLGSGGMGTVYEAEHAWTKRRVALKVLRPALAENEKIVQRFLREARACAKLTHPSLVEVLDMGQDEHDGMLFLAQELVAGVTLRAWLDERGTLALEDARSVSRAIGGALSVVHQAGIIHRDVKPENIMVERDARGVLVAKLIDFGVARELVPSDLSATRTSLGVPIGTPLYMSPEQARAAGAIDHRSDLYSLAAVIYECLSGATPHTGESVTVLLANILTCEPTPLSQRASGLVSPEVAAVVMKGLARDRAARFQSAREWEVAFDAACEGRAITAATESSPARSTPMLAQTLAEASERALTSTGEVPSQQAVASTERTPQRARRSAALAGFVLVGSIFVVILRWPRSERDALRSVGALDASASPTTTLPPLDAASADSAREHDAWDQRDAATSRPDAARRSAVLVSASRRPRVDTVIRDASTNTVVSTTNVTVLRAVAPDGSSGGLWLRPVIPR
ncbi:MAG: serine/threonine-protein kinase [Polyangiales bacterium]